ncbi:hypothetical protein SPACI_006760 [Sporomusa acidovorans DSM 3132]|uniref:Uncharacterized protein n=1 Tax=Sporomusa acidovorans (strain ATCC 49682 / DSM 3132 / Mol) TaxID=1123286 RepID=A0ABZ3IY47_SPOA4|nr:hypothetical protein SPACI_46320 [Sporomusa acidovorans DSM 3132]SDF30445.1 hypothetical protein SAMN04488499_104249 [Sporomusa acidovorans]
MDHTFVQNHILNYCYSAIYIVVIIASLLLIHTKNISIYKVTFLSIKFIINFSFIYFVTTLNPESGEYMGINPKILTLGQFYAYFITFSDLLCTMTDLLEIMFKNKQKTSFLLETKNVVSNIKIFKKL